MAIETVETLIVGGGQAGLAMSEQLSLRGKPHLILERHRIAERWRSERWDGLHANGPAWHDRLPAMGFTTVDPDGFAPRDRMVDYFVAYADKIKAPIRCGVTVQSARPKPDGTGFVCETSEGTIEATNLIAATGPFQRPLIPALVPDTAGLFQIHSSAYRNPAQLPHGAVLVVGGGSSGAQIADELCRAGRSVYLSIGRHGRPPRAYRGRDYCWWLGVLGTWDMPTPDPTTKHVTIAVSGAHGGETVDFRRLASRGITLLGRAERFDAGTLRIRPDLQPNLAEGDAAYLAILDAADAYVIREGLALPEEPEARVMLPDPACVTDPILALDLAKAGISAIVWATGYTLDFSWLHAGAYSDRGVPQHHRGMSDVPGLYFLGLSWLSRRGSAFVFGVAQDAAYLADHIAAR